MTWIYNVNANTFEQNGTFKFNGLYAGAEGYKNNTEFECEINKGSLPRGKYRISRPIAKHQTAGRFVLRLTPYIENEMCGRAGFLIHGDNGRGTASNGCIVATYDARLEIAESGDRELIVK
ncbi:tlde1 domain-containing protein [Erwinia sp. E_sp_B04_7]|uniref:tlde1 domain-containing protein n=1 Tax=unclassified Erwinia TaxID=2622719 RepID=UPI0030D0E682